jgi:hypothetical protein
MYQRSRKFFKEKTVQMEIEFQESFKKIRDHVNKELKGF